MPVVTWNYTTVLNIAFLLLAAVLLWRFLRTGGAAMLRMMDSSTDDAHPGPHDRGHSSSAVEHDGPPHHRPPHDRP